MKTGSGNLVSGQVERSKTRRGCLDVRFHPPAPTIVAKKADESEKVVNKNDLGILSFITSTVNSPVFVREIALVGQTAT